MLLTLAEEQKRLGLTPFIASIGEKGITDKVIEIEAKRRSLSLVKFRMHPGPNLVGAYQIIKFARRKNIDILHLHGYKGNILFGFIPKSFMSIPRVTTLHGWTATGSSFTRMSVYERIDAISLSSMDAVIIVNDIMQEHPRIKGRNLRLHIVPNGIPANDPHLLSLKLDRKIVNFCDKEPLIGTIGRLSPEKGHQFLIEAIKHLKPDFPALRLLIIGEGRLRKYLERQTASLGLRKCVRFAGYCEHAWRYFSLMNLFVLPSLTEGLPVTLLEAMRENCPILATRVGGIPAALDNGEAGLLVSPGNALEIAEGVAKVLTQKKDTHARCEKAKSIFKKRFSSDKMAKQYVEIYYSLAYKG